MLKEHVIIKIKKQMKKILLIIILFPTILEGQNKIEKWDVFELTLQGPSTGNPNTEVELSATFTNEGEYKTIKGFYDGDGMYKIRFMPEKIGIWKYETQSNASSLKGKEGKFKCIESSGNKGPVRVAGKTSF